MSAFAQHVAEVLSSLGDVQTRRMFGGFGVFRDGIMFALIADDTLYLKADQQNRDAFESRGLEPFVYYRGGKPVRLSYLTAPEEIFDDPEAAVAWAKRSFEAALRGRKPKRRGKTC